jgi:hypothetical protein
MLDFKKALELLLFFSDFDHEKYFSEYFTQKALIVESFGVIHLFLFEVLSLFVLIKP